MDQDTLLKIDNRFASETDKLVNLFKNKAIDNSTSWLAFKKGYDESTKGYEITLDSGAGTQVKFIFSDINIATDTDAIYYRLVVDGVNANNAEMNITNLRRHGFEDYKYGPAKKHMFDPYKIYQNFRFHDKVYNNNEDYIMRLDNNDIKIIGHAFEAVMRVGQKRQDKTGVAAHEKVAQMDFDRDIKDSIAAIQLVDTGMTEINEVIKDVRDWFSKIETQYNSYDAALYKNPYTGKSYVSMKVNVKFYTDNTKFKTTKDPKTDARYHLFGISYTVIFNNESNDCVVSENQWMYEKPYYFDQPGMELPLTLQSSVDLRAKIGFGVPHPDKNNMYQKSTVLKYLGMVINDMLKAQKVHDALLASLAL